MPQDESKIEASIPESSASQISVTMESPNEFGIFMIKFSQAVRLPSNFTSWDSENEGSEILELDYIPTEETKTILYDADVSNKVSWSISSNLQSNNESLEVDQIAV